MVAVRCEGKRERFRNSSTLREQGGWQWNWDEKAKKEMMQKQFGCQRDFWAERMHQCKIQMRWEAEWTQGLWTRVQGHSYTKDFLNLSHKFSLTGARQVTWGSKAVTEASHRRNPTPYGGSSIQLQLTDGWQGRIWTQVVRSSDFLFSREAIELIQDMFIKTVGQKSWQEKIGT